MDAQECFDSDQHLLSDDINGSDIPAASDAGRDPERASLQHDQPRSRAAVPDGQVVRGG
jgi:hypothetical protein